MAHDRKPTAAHHEELLHNAAVSIAARLPVKPLLQLSRGGLQAGKVCSGWL